MSHWVLLPEVEVPKGLAEYVGGNPLVAATLVRRGIPTMEAARKFLDPSYYQLADPCELPGIGEAADRVQRALRQGEPICVWGDFDADGQTSTSLLVSTLRDLGARVSYYIPNRKRESHGVHLESLKRIIEAGVTLVITCDTGIGAHEVVGYAKAKGIDFIITDHHALPEQLPEAVAVSNPRMLPEGHPLSTLPGVGAAYQLASELYSRVGKSKAAEGLLDLAAIGIVADVASLKGDARCLVQRGLIQLRNTRRLGLQALMELAELNPANLTEEHIGFTIGPRLNALGRLDDANLAVEFFTTKDIERARFLAQELDGLNVQRRLLTEQVYQGALANLERTPSLLQDPVLVLEHPAWHGGVVGIVASKLVEQFNRPAILISAPPGEAARGSARSIEGVNIIRAIHEAGSILEGYGGHPMAAGLAILPDRIPEFRRKICKAVEEQGIPMDVERQLELDALMPLATLNLELVDDLERLAPFGEGNPPLTLCAQKLTLAGSSPVGKNGEHIQLLLEDGNGNQQRVIWWQGGEAGNQAQLELMQEPFDLAYRVRSSSYQGVRNIQVEFVEARPAEVEEIRIAHKGPVCIDYRGKTQPLAALKEVYAKGGVQVWAEGEAKRKLVDAGIAAGSRYELQKGERLAIWTSPAGPKELREAVQTVGPREVILFAIQPEISGANSFLKRLAGLAKHALNAGGKLDIQRAATATAQREATVVKGILWLQAQGYLRVTGETGREIEIAPGSGKANGDDGKLLEAVHFLLDESSAYREYYETAEISRITESFETRRKK